MNAEVKTEFVAALRSGRYSQTKLVLRNGDKFCSSGVLCDLHAKKFGGRWIHDTYLGSEATAPNKVLAWAGIKPFASKLTDVKGNRRTLEGCNDNGLSFAEIADLIEKQW